MFIAVSIDTNTLVNFYVILTIGMCGNKIGETHTTVVLRLYFSPLSLSLSLTHAYSSFFF